MPMLMLSSLQLLFRLWHNHPPCSLLFLDIFLVMNKLIIGHDKRYCCHYCTAAMTIMALDLSLDGYDNISGAQCNMRFIWHIFGSASLSQLVLLKSLERRSFHVVLVLLGQQFMVSLYAFLFPSVGVITSNDFQRMASEATLSKVVWNCSLSCSRYICLSIFFLR